MDGCPVKGGRLTRTRVQELYTSALKGALRPTLQQQTEYALVHQLMSVKWDKVLLTGHRGLQEGYGNTAVPTGDGKSLYM